jgi:2-methylcitrate dehydratase
MKLHDVKVYPSKVPLAREDQLAWKIAGVATDKVRNRTPMTPRLRTSGAGRAGSN